MWHNSFIILWFLLALGTLASARSHRLAKRNSDDYIDLIKRGVLVKNGKLTSCELIPIDSRAAVVAASCLDFVIGTTLDSDTEYTVYYDSRNDDTEGAYPVDDIKVHPDFNPSTYVNDLAVLQFNSKSKATWQGRLAKEATYTWDEIVYSRANLDNLDDPSWSYKSFSGGINYDKPCDQLSEMYAVNVDAMVCSSNTTYAQSRDLNSCKIPMGIAFGIANEKAFLIGPYSYTAVGGGNDLCEYSYERSYYTAVGYFLGFIKNTIGRDLLVGDDKITGGNYNSNIKMIDKDYGDDNGIKSTKFGGDFFKDQKAASSSTTNDSSSSSESEDSTKSSSSEDPTNSSSSKDSSSTDSSSSLRDSNIHSAASSDNDESGLSQREKVIIAVCVSVGAAVVLGLIIFICWWKRWRDRDVADPMSQTLYQDAIETEIGGATVPALASNGNLVRSESTRELFAGTASESRHASMVHEAVRESIADTAPDYQRNSVAHGSTNLEVFHADLPPMYDEAVERRESSVPALAEKEDMKKGD